MIRWFMANIQMACCMTCVLFNMFVFHLNACCFSAENLRTLEKLRTLCLHMCILHMIPIMGEGMPACFLPVPKC